MRALSLAHKYLVPTPPPGTKPLADQLLDEMTPSELERFAVHRKWPDRFRSRLCARSTVPASATTPSAEAPDADDGDPTRTDAPVRAPPPRPHPLEPEPDTAARAACGDGDLSDDEEAPRAPTPRTAPVPVFHQPASLRSAAAARPEDRVWPPIDRPATLAADDHPDEPPPPPGTHRLAVVALVAGVAGCGGVTLPAPPTTTTDAERLCVLECQSQHSACLSGGPSPYLTAAMPPVAQAWSADRRQRACADQLAACYRAPCPSAQSTSAPPTVR